MEHVNTKKLAREGTEQVVEALKKEPFVIVVKTDKEMYELSPAVEVTIMTEDPLDAVVLAGRIVDLFKSRFQCDPIVEMQPFLDGKDLDK